MFSINEALSLLLLSLFSVPYQRSHICQMVQTFDLTNCLALNELKCRPHDGMGTSASSKLVGRRNPAAKRAVNAALNVPPQGPSRSASVPASSVWEPGT